MPNELRNFIIRARSQTYASGVPPQKITEKTYLVESGNLLYKDVYYDQERIFQGQEVVFHDKKPVWSFSYRGEVGEGQNSKVIFDHLRRFLRELVFNTRFDTPCEMQIDDFVYICQSEGDFSDFLGNEAILRNDGEIYHLNFFGGMIR